jgi:hypothetical protein
VALSVDPRCEHRLDQAADRCDRGLSPSDSASRADYAFLHGQAPEQTSSRAEFTFPATGIAKDDYLGDGTDDKDGLPFDRTAQTFTQAPPVARALVPSGMRLEFGMSYSRVT